MMEQENKQAQSEVTWEELTVEKMAKFMLDMTDKRKLFFAGVDLNWIAAGSPLFCSWKRLKGMVDGEDCKKKTNHEQLLYCAIDYLFTFVAVVNEKGTNNLAGDSRMRDIVAKYNIDIFCYISTNYHFNSQIIRIIPKSQRLYTSKEKEEEYRDSCWKKILGYFADGSCTLSPKSNMEEVFKWLCDKNQDEARQLKENYIVEYYNLCRKILNDWWKENGETLLEHSGIRHEDSPSAADLKKLDNNDFAEDAKNRIEQGVKQIIFTGAPGTGKTYAAKLIARCMGAKLQLRESEEPKKYALVQFHPSYDYTDFVEGLRPVQIGGENRFVKLDGSFKAFCRRVVKKGDPAKKYFFLIDEINRADLSKVFGELMFCLEADKRGPDNRVETQYQNLPTYDIEKARDLTPEEDVFHSGFFIPDNVIVIGTMNDIDRSVESMDFALRRRFDWMEAVVDRKHQDELKNALSRILNGMNDTEIGKLKENIFNLNDTIEAEGRKYGLTRQHFISQGQFANLPDLTKELTNKEDKDAEADKSTKTLVKTIKDYVWEYRLEPLLREYLRGEAEKDIDEFIGKCKAAFDRE